MLGIRSTKDVSDWDDTQLLAAAQSQPWLFGVLVERYQEPFLRKTRKIIYNPLDAEEVVQDAFTNGGTYTPPSIGVDETFEEKTYGLNGRTDWNSAVKKSMTSTFLDSNNLASVAMKKINATRYYNQLVAEIDNERQNLIDSVVFNQDTPEGQIAFENLFGSEEEVLADGTVKPGVMGLLETKFKKGLYKN